MQNNIDSISERWYRWGSYALLLSIALSYFFLHGSYRFDNKDDAWTLSFAYNWLHKGVEYDLTFGGF